MNRYSTLICLTVALVATSVTVREAPAAPTARGVLSTQAARALVVRYFHALESNRFREACSLLGSSLRLESGGTACPSFLKRGMPDPLRWRIFDSRQLAYGIGVRLELGQNELDHVRMRTWLAIVRLETGGPRIVETRLVT